MTIDLFNIDVPRPFGGDAIRLTGPWSTVSTGAIGIINGFTDEPQDEIEVTFRYSAFRGWSAYGCPEHDQRTPWHQRPKYQPDRVACEVSGGPGTIALPASFLRPTNETIDVVYWCWKDLPRARGGMYYKLPARVWEWDGKEQ